MSDLKEFLKFYGLMFIFAFIGIMLIFQSITGIFIGREIISGRITMNLGFIFIIISMVIGAYFRFKHRLH